MANITNFDPSKQDSLEEKDRQGITTQLYRMAKKTPGSSRRVLSILFEPNSMQLRSERIKGRKWGGYLDGYRITEAIEELEKQSTFFKIRSRPKFNGW